MNVVVYVSDALRVDHLGCYGARFLNTKTIDELAAGGIRFDQAISAAPWTEPSMTSMVTDFLWGSAPTITRATVLASSPRAIPVGEGGQSYFEPGNPL